MQTNLNKAAFEYSRTNIYLCQGGIQFITICLFVGRITQIMLLVGSSEKNESKLDPTLIPLSSESDLDNFLSTKNIDDPDFSIFLLLSHFFKIICAIVMVCSPQVLLCVLSLFH